MYVCVWVSVCVSVCAWVYVCECSVSVRVCMCVWVSMCVSTNVKISRAETMSQIFRHSHFDAQNVEISHAETMCTFSLVLFFFAFYKFVKEVWPTDGRTDLRKNLLNDYWKTIQITLWVFYAWKMGAFLTHVPLTLQGPRLVKIKMFQVKFEYTHNHRMMVFWLEFW